MSAMRVIGIVRGNSIELQADPGLSEGQVVRVSLEPISEVPSHSPGDGIRRSAGGWSNDEVGLDEFLAWNRQQRKGSVSRSAAE